MFNTNPGVPKEIAPNLPLPPLKGAATSHEALKIRLKEVPYFWKVDGLTVSGNFYYPSFASGAPTIKELVDLVYWNVIPYCLPRKVREEKDKLYQDTGDVRYMTELLDQAIGLFSKAQKTIAKAGEPGEIILFMLAEAVLKAPQIACKMYLKTNSEMPVHGSDGVHIAFDSESNTLKLFWGESKLYEQLPSALDQICASFSSFLEDVAGTSPKDRDVDIIKDHADIIDPNQLDLLLKYFDPYEPESNHKQEHLTCFVGFEFSAYAALDKLSITEREKKFEEVFAQRITSACTLFAEKIKKSSFSETPVHFFLIPFPNIQVFRTLFFTKLGVPVD